VENQAKSVENKRRLWKNRRFCALAAGLAQDVLGNAAP
jgi:hypothetical protein